MENKIVQNGAAVLRQKAAEIPLAEIGGAKIKTLIAEMQAALLSQDDGVALAAPQVGAALRLFIVSKAALALPVALKERDKVRERRAFKKKEGYFVFINPRLTKLSREKTLLEEGCLSVRPLYGMITRSKKATITAHDETGKKFTRGASGLLAQVFQHETDHLDGILFIDKATELHEMKNDYED